MLSSISQFPREELISNIKSKPQALDPFFKEIKNLNIQWIYQIIKHLHNTLFQSKQSPQIKLNALKITKRVLQSCEIPCLTLIQTYILPTIFDIACYKPKLDEATRGARFFIDNGYSHRIPKIEQTGVQFVNLCVQMIFVGSLIKTKRTLLNQQLLQQSQFVAFNEKLKKIIKKNLNSPAALKYFKEKDVFAYQKKYREKLSRFEPLSQAYSSFFVRKMIESLQSEANILFSIKSKSISSLSNELDMRKLLKYGDSYITSPLIQEISDGITSSQNFIVKKNFLSILSDLIKFADIEAILQVMFDSSIESIAANIAQVKGENGLMEGQNIYPSVKGQRQAKKKFYIEFLKAIEIWAKIVQQKGIEEDTANIEQLYQYFKGERKFVFPENVMMKHIEDDYQKCREYNQERNQKILQKLRQDEESVMNKKSKSLHQKKSVSLHKQKKLQTPPKPKSLDEIENNLENLIQDFISLCDQDNKIHEKMGRLLEFRDKFDEELEDIGEQVDEARLMEILDEGDGLIDNLQPVVKIYDDYKNNKISLDKFRIKFQANLEALEQSQSNQTTSHNQPQDVPQESGLKQKQKKPNEIIDKIGNSGIKIKADEVQMNLKIISLNQNEPQQSVVQNDERKQFERSNISDEKSQHLIHLQNKSISSISRSYSKKPAGKEESINHQDHSQSKRSQYGNKNLNMSVREKIQEYRSMRGDNSVASSSYFIGTQSKNRMSKLNKSVKEKYRAKQQDMIPQQYPPGPKTISKVEISKIKQRKQSVLEKSRQISKIRKNSRLSSSHCSSLSRRESKISKSIKLKKGKKTTNDPVDEKQLVCQAYEMKQKKKIGSADDSSKLILKHKDSKLNANTKDKYQENHYGSRKIDSDNGMRYKDSNAPSNYFLIQNNKIDNYYIRPEAQNDLRNPNKGHNKAHYGIEEFRTNQAHQATNKISAKKNINMSSSSNIIQQRQHSYIKAAKITQQKLLNNPDQEYLMLKVRKQQEEQKNKELRNIHQKIFRLKSQSSRLRSELSSRSLKNRQYSVGRRPSSTHSQQSYQSFHRSKSSSNRSQDYRGVRSSRASRTSQASIEKKASMTSLEGRLVNDNQYKKNELEEYDIQTRKTLLRNKTLVYKDEELQIGSLFRKDKNSLKILIYLTPQNQLKNVTYQISEEKNVECRSYPESFFSIPAKKQVKLTFMINLHHFLYKFPRITLQYQTIDNYKTQPISFWLPCPLHKFVEFCPVANPKQFQYILDNNQSSGLRTDQFRINRKVMKVDLLKQYFPGLTLLRKQGQMLKYGATCKYMNQCFSLMILANGSSSLMIQGIPHSQPEFVESFMKDLRNIMRDSF